MATIKIGDPVPDTQLMMFGDAGPTPIKTSELLAGKTVVLFAVPGAFTPTCSNQHLPGYVTQADALRAKGVDSIICISVNDVFVMDAWGKQRGTQGKVQMVADGNGALVQAMGLDLDASAMGMGVRSRRFAMLVKDGVVQQLYIEDNPAQAEQTSADVMLKSLS